MADFFEQWKYSAFTKGADNRSFYLMTLIIVPVLLLMGVAALVVWVALPEVVTTFVKIAAFACPVAALVGIGGAYATLML